MVYCNLEKVNNGIALYSIGGYVDDITGTLQVDFKTQEYEFLKKPPARRFFRGENHGL